MLSLQQQLELFGSCQILAGFSGSALHNILFCPPGTAIISLGDRRTRDTLLPNQRLCNAIGSSQMALIPFASGEHGFDLSVLRAEVVAAQKLVMHAPDEPPLNSFLNSLAGELDYTGEFGAELVLFTPFCGWLSKVGLLKNRRIRTYFGMRCFYDDLDCLEIVEKKEPRRYVPPHERPPWLPIKNEHNFDNVGRSPFHFYTDLRTRFRKLPLIPEIGSTARPLLIVHNKHNDEWNGGPVNHIPLGTLETLFKALKDTFTIVYIRHEGGAKEPGFSEDHNIAQPFEDRPLLDRYPQVRCFQDLYALHHDRGGTQDLNTFKNVLYSRCYHFISSQGGGAHQIALFSGSLLVILHRRGLEENWAYGDGYYSFMASVPPIRAICRTENDLVRALPIFNNTAIVENRVFLSVEGKQLLSQFSFWTGKSTTGCSDAASQIWDCARKGRF